ncbi:MAG: NUDIX hydrolase [Gaiellaceae bacterium]
MEPQEGAAAAAILDSRDWLLLVKESYDRRRYSFPGGAVEHGESPLDTAVRETKEETASRRGSSTSSASTAWSTA